ncbi:MULTISPECIES: hypothetical protein [unclassified Shewanella]|jgi:hypothetical protein|uniref:hypothetical protein n=1 Tax=unclassified Shewanella TaxID=196818 RepID=UPI000C7BD596|nr:MULTISPECIES: hypothetical protein [unclassified Shewanella]PKG58889.1 hypothetical protein CXF82_02115 [Shewanella sp. GutDb-MelDb]PKG73495.1 hypothetical protein CXF86_17450 [Shewanella sp. GutCb]
MNKIIIVIFLLNTLAFSGCTSLNDVQPNSDVPIANQINIGDTVVITMLTGEAIEFSVETITKNKISGEGQNVDVKKIEKIEKREFSGAKTSLLAISIAYLVGVSFWGVLF